MVKAGLVAFMALLAVPAAGAAQDNFSAPHVDAAAADEQARATDEALLEALTKRRAEVERSKTSAEGKRAALQFLDAQISRVKARLGAS